MQPREKISNTILVTGAMLSVLAVNPAKADNWAEFGQFEESIGGPQAPIQDPSQEVAIQNSGRREIAATLEAYLERGIPNPLPRAPKAILPTGNRNDIKSVADRGPFGYKPAHPLQIKKYI